ncbi:MAG: geranylgeranylglycerol-phosphate geranylgeranyltransferase [Candidatus Latescibacteria bacterium]|nr:geranylgeranylglycerol-phosphate geranylgeranyltransferase [Candidatus Latescibacterota bacterium]
MQLSLSLYLRRSHITLRSLSAYLALLRPVNCLIVSGSVFVGAFIAGVSGNFLTVLAAGLSAALIAGGANGINDFYDAAIDRVNKPWRPIPSGRVGKREAFVWSTCLLVLGVAVGGIVGNLLLIVALGAAISVFLYSFWLKRTPFWGNLTVSLLCGLAFLYGGISVGKPKASLIPAWLAFLFHLGREIIKDAQDCQADASVGASTAPVRFGLKTALRTTTAVYTMLLATLFLPYLFGIYHRFYLLAICIGVVPVLCYVIWSMWQDYSPQNLSRLSTLLKLAMVIGLLAILLGTKF